MTKKSHTTRTPSAAPDGRRRDLTPGGIRESEERYRRLFETAQDGILILDAETGAITDANPFITNSLGYTLPELMGKRLWEIGAFADVKDSKAAFEQLQQQEYIRYNDLPLRTKGGEVREVEFVSNAYLVNGQKVIQCNIRDITERRAAEAASERTGAMLRSSEERYRRLFETAQDGILILDAGTGSIIDANPFIIESLGYPLEELQGKRLWEIGAFADVKESKQAFEELQRTGYIRYSDLPLKTKDGQQRHVEFVSNVYLVAGAKVIQCNIRDITDRKRAEEKIREIDERFTNAFENAPIGMALVSSDGHWLKTNRALSDLLGYTEAEFLDRSILDFTFPEDITSSMDKFQRAMSGNENSYRLKKRYVHKLGHVITVLLNTSFIRNTNGQPSYFISHIMDISEREKSELALRNAENKYRLIVENAVDGIYQTSPEGNILTANRAMTQILGFSTQEELIRERADITRLGYVDPRRREDFKKLMEIHGVVNNFEYEAYRKDGSKVWVSENAQAVRNEDGSIRYFEGSFKDITERKTAEIALNESNQKFHQLADNISDAFWIRSPDLSEVQYVSRAFETIWGRTMESLYADPHAWVNYIHPDDRARVTKRFDALTGEMPTLDIEYRIVRPDGEIRWVHVRGFQIRSAEDMLVRHIGIVTDITERKESEGIQRESARRFKEMLENIDLLALLLDREGNVTFCNDYLLRLTGYPRERVTGQNWFRMFIPPETSIEQLFTEAMAHGSLPPHNENELITASGERRLISWNNIELRDMDGQVIGSSSIGEDITERKRAEQLLRASEEKYHGIFENIQDVFFETLLDGTIREISPSIALASKGQYHREEMIGRPMSDYYSDPSVWQMLIARLQEHGSVSDVELTMKNREGSQIQCSVSARLQYDRQGHPERIIGSLRDITERIKAQEALRTSEEQYRLLFDNSLDGILVTHPDGSIDSANSAACRIFGATEPEIIALGRDGIVDSNDPRLPAALRERNNTGKFMGELFLVRKDGSRFPSEVSTALYKDTKGNFVSSMSIRDISQRKEAEKQLDLLAHTLRSIIECVTVTDLHNRILFVNAAFLNTYGYTEEEIVGSDISVIRTAGNSSESTGGILEATLGGGWSGELMNRKKNGEEFPVSLSTSCVRDENGTAVALVGVATDITARRSDEIHLLKSEERYRNLVELSPSAIIVHNHKTIIYVNPAAVKLLAAGDASQLIGIPIRDILHSDHKESARLRMSDNANNPVLPLSKEKFLRLDGVTIDVEVVSLLIEFDGTSAMQDVVRDVTEQKRYQEALLQTQKSESIGTLAGGIAHDFNNILGIILGYSSIIEKRGLDAEVLRSSVASINQAVMRGAALVRQILTFARKTEISFVPISVSDLAAELVSMLSQTFPKVIRFHNSISPSLPFILADRTQLHQVFLNLCVNARDAMPKGGSITIAAETTPGPAVKKLFPEAGNQDYVCISVADTGEGMDDATRKRIFDPFYTTKPQGKGTGLGLSVVYGVVQAHQGFISVSSIPGAGTTFRMYLPTPESGATTEVLSEPLVFLDGGTETILLVEDELPLVQMVEFLLESKGYTILTAHDGAEAVMVYLKHRSEIALVVTDLGLPVMTGLEEYKKLQEIEPGVKVVFASGFIEPEVRAELTSRGAKHFLQKPYVESELLKIIREALR